LTKRLGYYYDYVQSQTDISYHSTGQGTLKMNTAQSETV
jgi:hypothetical protein